MTAGDSPNTNNMTSGPGRFLRRHWLSLLLVLIVTAAHYNTAFHIHALHGIYRRLYYFPIILAGFRGGTRGGLAMALLVCGVYLPHAMGLIGFDPGTTVEKSLEMLLYLAVGLLTGSLVSRINAAGTRLAETAADLRRTLDEKTAMEEELVRSARLAAVGRLSAGLAHEIRNPLASIKGSAEVLADDYPPEHPKSRLLAILQQETGRLNTVLTRFLAFARSEPGELRTFDLTAEARAVVDLMAHQPDTAPVILHTEVPQVSVQGNAEQIRQVILNLALNAASANPGTDPVEISVRLAGDRGQCLVCDHGPGFSQEAMDNFGTPFYSTREGGTGLGLATSLRIVEDQGGTLEVDREHRGGACVVLSLPVANEPEGK